MTDEQQQQRLTALLRLKRYEQPPPGYYQKLLNDVHRRQRAELLRRPLWKIALERLHTFVGEHNLGNLSYAGATAAAVVAILAVVGLSLPEDSGKAGPTVAAAASERHPVDLRANVPTGQRLLTLQNGPVTVAMPPANGPVVDARLLPIRTVQSVPSIAVKQPRYVIDSRPASYATTVSYQF
jgi:hypothetical protein